MAKAADASSSPQSVDRPIRSPFTELPRELRDKIYRDLLVIPKVVIDTRPVSELAGSDSNPKLRRSTWRADGDDRNRRKFDDYCMVTYGRPKKQKYEEENYNLDLHIMGTCRDMYREATKIFYAENIFHFPHVRYLSPAVQFTPVATLVARFLQDRPSEARMMIRSIIFNAYVCSPGNLISHILKPFSYWYGSRRGRRRRRRRAQREPTRELATSSSMNTLWDLLKDMRIRELSIYLFDAVEGAMAEQAEPEENFNGDVYALDTHWTSQMTTLPFLKQFSIIVIDDRQHHIEVKEEYIHFEFNERRKQGVKNWANCL
ncbi:hypothetical protein NA57DRAFT_56940 [Rhizodiscina lignyota]|uniref:DUF7730 domain-containing protein n=1 Tax=Rhizodiscina lignyota TaxID=1504668 RepID=A0A9P4IFX5_9PEZI|nr:hypothetical protein NA57DRAFT_56940 [Rhizodiscina lignyota]